MVAVSLFKENNRNTFLKQVFYEFPEHLNIMNASGATGQILESCVSI